jgi:hypothetical protein
MDEGRALLASLPTTLQLKRAAMADPNLTQKARPFASEFLGNSKRLQIAALQLRGRTFFKSIKAC